MQTQVNSIIKQLQSFFHQSGLTKAVIGLSGGIDSALVAKLAVMSLGADNITGILLPNDSITKTENILDAENWAKELGINYHQISINSFLENYKSLPWNSSKLANINIQSRVRMTILYHYANTHDCLVLGTGNKTELMLGYFTKYGDGGVDVLPIGDLFKTEVFKMGQYLGLPKAILTKAPSAELIEAQTDEADIGMTYMEIDQILMNLDEVADNEKTAQIKARININAHKLKLAPIFYLT